MLRLVIMAALLAVPLAAEHESNFGRVILANCDIVVHGVAGATRLRVGAQFKVDVNIENVLYGEEKRRDVSFYYTDPDSMAAGAVRGVFALKALAEGAGYKLVGKPVLTPVGDADEGLKLRVAREFIALERDAAGPLRTESFFELLVDHILLGDYAARNAAVELMFVARDRGAIVTNERFVDLLAAREAGLGRLTKATQEDLKLAFQGMVEARIKGLKFRDVRRGETRAAKRCAADELAALLTDYPRAFTEADATLADGLRRDTNDEVLSDKLRILARDIRAEVRNRELEDEQKAAEARKRIRHAEGK